MTNLRSLTKNQLYVKITFMSEKFNHLNTTHITERSRELLGEKRLDPLGAFSTEEHLQRVIDDFRRNPDMAINHSLIGGGSLVIKEHHSTLEIQLPETTPDRLPRISVLHNFFRLGYGLVEHAVEDHSIRQTDPSQMQILIEYGPNNRKKNVRRK